MPGIVVFALGALAGAAGTLRCPETAGKVMAAVRQTVKKVAKTCLGNQESPPVSDHTTDGETRT